MEIKMTLGGLSLRALIDVSHNVIRNKIGWLCNNAMNLVFGYFVIGR